MNIVNATSLKWQDASRRAFTCMVEFENGDIHPFGCSPDDVAPHGRDLWTRATDGEFGPIAPADGISLPALHVELTVDVDNRVAEIYARFTRFEREYAEREKAARAFKAGGYLGLAGVWISSFAGPTGKTPREAADLIIAQADALHLALEQLAAVRMRKYEIQAAQTETAARQAHASILAHTQTIAAALH